MSQRHWILRRPIRIVRRHRLLAGIVTALGMLTGGAYAVPGPPRDPYRFVPTCGLPGADAMGTITDFAHRNASA